MKVQLFFGIVILLFLSSCHNAIKDDIKTDGYNGKEISFYTSDSIKIIGDLYEIDKSFQTILLFHQGGSNARGEYVSIIPKLIKKKYNVIAVDQRLGGQLFGSYNRTLANITESTYGSKYGYCDAYNNLEATLDFIIDAGFTGEKILWGSSYSATLAIQLANERPDDVQGVLAFSPPSGGPMEECRPDTYFETLKTPLLILRPPSEMENESVKIQFEMAAKNNLKTYIAKNGSHGSSMLVKERVGKDVEENWKVVWTFLENIKTIK